MEISIGNIFINSIPLTIGSIEVFTYTIILLAGVTAILYAFGLIWYVFKQPPGKGRMVEIHNYIREGAKAYLKRQYAVILSIAGIIALFLIPIGPLLSLSYFLGALSSVAAGYTGMWIAVHANVRTTNAAKEKGVAKALRIAFSGGMVLGLMVVGVGTLLIILQYILYGATAEAVKSIIGYSFGASTAALFARTGGGIYTKAADIGADLVGKIEAGIPEDDPRNPGVIADNVGDNVGDVAGMGADLFESYVGSIISTMVIAATALGLQSSGAWVNWALTPLFIASAGIFSSIITSLLVRVKEGGDPSKPLTMATIIGGILIAAFSLPSTIYLLGFDVGLKAFIVVVFGIIAGIIVGLTSDYFTNPKKPPVRKVAYKSQTGAALTILTGLAYGFESVLIPIIGIATAELVAYFLLSSYGFWFGIYGVALAAVGMLSLTGIVVSADAYGPITDNAAGIAEQAGLGEEVRSITDKLDAAGNTMKSVCKGFAIGSAALTALAYTAAYSSILLNSFKGVSLAQALNKVKSLLSLLDPKVISGALIGAALPAIFTTLVILAVSDAAFVLIEEIRRQFREKPGILEFKEKPDYGKAVSIVTSYALRRLIAPGLLAIIAPLVIGYFLGPYGLAGSLIAAIVTGLMLGLFQGNVGNTWDNAKKYVEDGHFGGKGSETHKATVIGDTVGDPLKDASGPSINILIKLMSVVSLVSVQIIVHYNLVGLLGLH